MARARDCEAAAEFARAFGLSDPEQAVRLAARELLATCGGAPRLPSILEALRVRKVRTKEMILEGALKEAPDGRFDVWVRADRSAVRQRFSVAHECGHVLFYRHAPVAKLRQVEAGAVADEAEERLCNVAAEELLMPQAMMESLIAGASCPLAVVQRVAAECNVSVPAALLRVAPLWRQPGILQAFEYDRSWKMAIARRTGAHHLRPAAFRPDRWGPGDLAAAARGQLPESTGWLIDRSTSTVALATTRTATIGSADRRLAFLCFHDLDVRGGRERESAASLDSLGREIRRIAQSMKGLEGCTHCRGSGWHERARGVVDLCECRLTLARTRVEAMTVTLLAG
ncbi:MAG: ImmA/IrrE family metallo-endopeptidase [Myxococcota bacterium]